MLYDITPLVTPSLGVWPGDTAAERQLIQELAKGDTVTLSTLRATVHLGAHADAPSHYGLDAPDIASRALDYYLGPCRVIRAEVGRNRRIGPEIIEGRELEPRLLFATGTYPDPNQFSTDFAALSPELVDACHAAGVRLIGIDTPSVDLFDCKDLRAHRRFLAHDMAILEGIVLDRVPEGRYELVALPLKLQHFDASPVRALLRTL